MARKIFLCLALIVGVFLSASPVLPCEKILFGPKEFTVGRFHFHSSFQSFKAGNSGDAILEISSANSHGKLRSGFVSLNGRFYSLHPIIHSNNSTMEVPVQLRSRNYLFVFLYGQRGAAIKLKVKESKQEPTNHVPVAVDQAVELDEDLTAFITLAGSDQDSDPLTFRIVSAPAHGTLSGDAPALNYTPSADYNGSDMFTFIVNDGQADSQAATVNITIKPVNDPPKAVSTSPAQARVGEEVVLDGSRSSDVDGDKLTYLWTWASSWPAGLEPTLSNATTPSASFVPYLPGEYKARLVVNDGAMDSEPAMVTVSVAYPPFSLTEEKLTAATPAPEDRFGSSVAVDNHRAIIGAEGKEAAYIFESSSPWSQTALLRANDGTAGDHFGSAVAMSGDYALVGAYGDDDPGDDNSGEDAGSAYIFRRDGTQWTQAAKLVAGDGKPGDFFGAAIALSGDYAVVGAYGDDTDEETWIQVFDENKYIRMLGDMFWNPTLQAWESKKSVNPQFILKPNPAEGWANNFRPLAIRVTHTSSNPIALLQVSGVTNAPLVTSPAYASRKPVRLSGVADIGLINAYFPPAITNIEFLVPPAGGGPDAGSAYVFKREGTLWTQQAYLTAKDGAEGDAFGISVAISHDTILVGADRDDDNGEDSGSAYIFAQVGSGWMEEGKILAADGQAGDQFGASVAISGNLAVVGAPGADDAEADCGTAYVFWHNGKSWNQEAKLVAGDGKAGDQFGASVSISGDYLVVGAPGAGGSGALYVFKFDGSEWILEEKVVAKDRADGQEFGGSVSISGDTILSGAAGDSNQAGAAYAYTIKTYHTASIGAEPELIESGVTCTLSWSWINALVVQVEPEIGTFDVDGEPIGSYSVHVSPEVTTTYTLTAYGPYGKDVASVTVEVAP